MNQEVKSLSKMLVLYDTRSGDSGRMARALADGAESVQGVQGAYPQKLYHELRWI